MDVNKSALHQPKTIEISPETRALVEQKMPHASDATKQKTMEVMESLKQKGLCGKKFKSREALC